MCATTTNIHLLLRGYQVATFGGAPGAGRCLVVSNLEPLLGPRDHDLRRQRGHVGSHRLAQGLKVVPAFEH